MQWFAVWLVVSVAAAQAPFPARVSRILGPLRVQLENGRTVRLQGLALPADGDRAAGAGERLRSFVARSVDGKDVWVTVDAITGDEIVALVAERPVGRSVNESALEAGLAVFHANTDRVSRLSRLISAGEAAQLAGRGLFAPRPRPRFANVPYQNGAVLGLHYKEPDRSYDDHVDELAAAGFQHVSLLFPVFVQDARSSTIIRDHRRTVSDARLIATIRRARAHGMAVLLLPIVLLLDAGDDDWRGTLTPADPGRFWRDYDRFLCHYLDIAQATGVTSFSVGSELGSLETNTTAWIRVIQNARGRFTGMLTYSVNWDHVLVPRFLSHLDFVGMTAYFSLTEKDDPQRTELSAAWREQAARLEKLLRTITKPIVFTELGYASQDGINRDPWNYYINPGKVDLGEQADCFAAFLAVVAEMRFLRGAYFYDFFDPGGENDHTYSPRGKPALALWKQWATFEGRLPAPREHRDN